MASDVLAYALVVTAGTILLAFAGAVTTGGGTVRVKLLLFLSGWALMAIATFRLWPKSPKEVGADVTSGRPATTSSTSSRPTRIETVAGAIPPFRWTSPPERRLSAPAKLFVGSVFVLATSLLLEVVFAVE